MAGSRAQMMMEALDKGLVRAALTLRQQQAEAQNKGADPYFNDPIGFVENKLQEFLWSKQREVCQSVVDNPRTVVPSCYNVGKSRVASRIAAWWLNTRPVGQAFVVTTAPTASQVRAILWREIQRAYWSGGLAGRVNQTEWFMSPGGGHYVSPIPGEELVAIGRKSADYDEHAFQGIHQRYLLVIIDEGAGVAGSLYDAAESLASNDDSRILVIGNPTDPQSKMAEITTRPGSRWNVVTIDAYQSPNWTTEPIPDDLRGVLLGKRYAQTVAEDSFMVAPGEPVREYATCNLCPLDLALGAPIRPHLLIEHGLKVEDGVDLDPRLAIDMTPETPAYKNRVRGQFTADDPEAIVPLSAVRRCQVEREWAPAALYPVELGCDVGAGGDEFVVRERRGPKVGRKWGVRTNDWRIAVETALQAIRESGASSIKVDVIGIGWGVHGRLEELYFEGVHMCRPIAVNVGAASMDPIRYPKLRDQIWFEIGKELSIAGAWDLSGLDESTVTQLTAPRRIPDSAGRSKVEPKEDTKDRLPGHRSPDDADALLLAYFQEAGRPFEAALVGARGPTIPPSTPGAPVVAGQGIAELLGPPIRESRRNRQHFGPPGSPY